MAGLSSRVLVHVPARTGEYERQLRQVTPGVGLEVQAAASVDEVRAHRLWPEFFLGAGVPPEILLDMPRLEWIQWAWAGVDRLMIDSRFSAAVAAGRPLLTRAVGLFGPSVAEYVLAWCLFLTQDIPRTLGARKRRTWRRFEPGTLGGKRLGVAGLGSIGAEVARREGAMDLDVWGLRRCGPGVSSSTAPGCVSRLFGPDGIKEFVSGVDFLVLTLPLTTQTRGLFGGELLRLMKPTATLINVGRGGVVDEDGLLAALGSGRPSWAVLDVVEKEPLPRMSPLWSLPNVVITPHHAGLSRPADIAALFLRNLAAYRAGLPLEGLVRGDLGY